MDRDGYQFFFLRMSETKNTAQNSAARFFEQFQGCEIPFIGQRKNEDVFHIIHIVIHNYPHIYDENMNFRRFCLWITSHIPVSRPEKNRRLTRITEYAGVKKPIVFLISAG